MDQNNELASLKLSYRTTLEIVDKETGREERKVWKDGELIEHVVLKEGDKTAIAGEV